MWGGISDCLSFHSWKEEEGDVSPLSVCKRTENLPSLRQGPACRSHKGLTDCFDPFSLTPYSLVVDKGLSPEGILLEFPDACVHEQRMKQDRVNRGRGRDDLFKKRKAVLKVGVAQKAGRG